MGKNEKTKVWLWVYVCVCVFKYDDNFHALSGGVIYKNVFIKNNNRSSPIHTELKVKAYNLKDDLCRNFALCGLGADRKGRRWI
jgi:hypothetical protein